MQRSILASLLAVLTIMLACAPPTESNGADPTPTPSASPTPTATPGDTPNPESQTLELTVTEDGFVPTPAMVKSDVPLQLIVTRITNSTCAREIVIADYGINTPLPMNTPVTIELTPGKEDIDYACAMGMIRGTLTVE